VRDALCWYYGFCCALGQSPDVGNLALSQMWLTLLYHFRIWNEGEGRAVGLVD
jgi:hypothetical protein